MHYVTRIVCHGALGLLLFAAGCKTVVRFATGTITSGGNPVPGAQNAAVGLAVDVAANPGGEAAQVPQIITVLVPETGLQKVVPWREGMTVYTNTTFGAVMDDDTLIAHTWNGGPCLWSPAVRRG